MALAQFRLLQRCCTTIPSSLRRHDLLQCARLIVISRLLLKSLGDVRTPSKSLDSLGKRLTSLRRQLLLHVQSNLINPRSKSSDLLESICSYCLVTSSSAEDAFAHFQQLRLDKIRRQLLGSTQHVTIREALRYQLSSLQTFKSLVGRPIVDAMNHMQQKPLLSDPSIRVLGSLDLERIFSLIPDDIQSFVPYFKRSTLTSKEMQAQFESWSKDACQAISVALRHCLADTTHLEEVLALRKQLYTLLLPSYFSTPSGFYIKEQMADAINEKVNNICLQQSTVLESGTNLLLDQQAVNVPAPPLWDEGLALSSLSAGGHKFIRQVSKRHAGYDNTTSKASRALSRWISTANTTLGQLEEVSKSRWRDILEEPDEENEDDAIAVIKTLSEADPKLYREALHVSLREAMLKHETGLAQAIEKLVHEEGDLPHAVALLRSAHLSMSWFERAFPERAKFEGLLEALPRLREMVANGVAEQLCKSAKPRSKPSTYDQRILPDNMPSPGAFSTLRRLCKIMVGLGGTDLWSPPLVELVKRAVRTRILEPGSKGSFMENDFDEAYLGFALGQSPTAADQDGLNSRELAKSASQYWTRTKLLFGVLS